MIEFGDSNVVALSSMLEIEYSGREILAKDLFEEHQKKTQFASNHYLKTLRKMVDDQKIKSVFTDSSNHKVNVLLNDNCKLIFN